jgi:adenylate kinase
MNIVLLGPQGSGKGTQAKFISKKFNIPHISTGDIFRKNIKEETELGKLASSYINKGELVPDEVTNKLVESRIKEDDCKEGYILDGFPRNLSQAKFLDSITKISHAVDIEIPDEEVIFRLEGRRTCTNKECGAIYNVNTSPKPKNENKCDKCGSDLFQRDDDKPEAIKKRLEIYHNETSPLIAYYEKKGVLIKIDGTKSIEEVSQDILSKLK